MAQIQVHITSKKTLKDIPNQKLVKNSKFTAGYKNTLVDYQDLNVYIGSDLKKIKTADPFYKVYWYEMGAAVAKSVSSLSGSKIVLKSIAKNLNPDTSDISDFVLGLKQALWKFDKYKKKKEEKQKEVILSKDFAHFTKDLDFGRIEALNEASTLTRSLIDDTPEAINPTTIQDIIKSEFGECGNVSIKWFLEDDIKKEGMNAIHAVGRASVHRPCMVHLTIKPNLKALKKVVLVGKGVTYDSGGLDIKYGGSMAGMKTDMGGGGTLLGVAKALSKIGLENTQVDIVIPFVENMIDGGAYKADDIVTTYSGQTVEIINTDAEGRMILSDALAYATLLDPDYIIDIATLTGMSLMANGVNYTAMMGNDNTLQKSLMKVFTDLGERTHINALPEPYRKTLKGTVSDLVHYSAVSGGIVGIKSASHLTAGLYLSHFVDQNNFRNESLKIKKKKAYSWVHLDAAGSLYNSNYNQLGVSGATGQHVRGLVEWLLTGDTQ